MASSFAGSLIQKKNQQLQNNYQNCRRWHGRRRIPRLKWTPPPPFHPLVRIVDDVDEVLTFHANLGSDVTGPTNLRFLL